MGKAELLTDNASSPVRAKVSARRWKLSQASWAALVFTLIFGGGLLVAANKRAEFRADLKEDTGLVREQLARRFESVISDMVRPMRRFGRDILSGNISSPSNFQKSAESLQHEIHAYRKMWWLDASGVCVAASKNGEAQIGHRLSEQPGWEYVRNAVESRTDSYAMLDPGQDRPRLVAVIPVRPDNTDQIVGFVVARLDIRDVLEKYIDEHTIERFNIEVRDPSGNILLPARVNVPEPKDFSTDEPIKVLGVTWHLAVWPLEKFISHKPQGEEWMAIWGSLVLGIVAACGVWQELEHRRRDRAYQSALEALGKMTGAIAAAPESGRQILRQVTQIAADLLEMPICVFSLWDEGKQRFEVIYSQSQVEALVDVKEYYSMEDLPATRKAFAISAPVYASDITRNPECFDQESSRRHGIRSSIIVPLHLEGKPVGMLALSHKRSRKFSKSDVRLATVFGAQAAVTVVNSELHGQTQRDAQAKVVLLRELNHRVKNNLASIAGLLCTSPVELPDEVRQWLDRMIERVNGMSRLHELVMDGTQSISVPELMRKAVDAVMLLWPPGVRLSLDLHGEQATLTTDRAITLAMVVHELLFNALRHGVSNKGIVWINSRVEENHVIIDVIDDASRSQGQGTAVQGSVSEGGTAVAGMAVVDRAAVQVGSKTGLGWQLVRGLVGRELQGQFTFSKLPDGRTLARVVFHAIRQA